MVRRGVNAVLAASIASLLALAGESVAQTDMTTTLAKPDGAIRIATFNVQLARRAPSRLISELRDRESPQVDAVVEIIQRVRPGILLLNEVDYDPFEEAIALLQAELAVGRNGAEGVAYPHRYLAPVNTGVQSGFDLDQDGEVGGPGDAWGWGRHPGQYGMVVLSAYPIAEDAVRTFQGLLWRDAVAGLSIPAPAKADGAPYYAAAVWAQFPLSSKSHWDVPVDLPSGKRIHLLASHPTPPVFDGPEDRNGLRNAAEIALWSAYLDQADWMTDDQGRRGGLAAAASAVVLGDLNADPKDGDGRRDVIASLLAHPRLQDPSPQSLGAAAASADQAGANGRQNGDPALDTADWRDGGGGAPGNLRVDYVLPTRDLTVLNAGVFWPAPDDPLARLVGRREIMGRDGRPFMVDVSSDHRLVWIDIQD